MRIISGILTTISAIALSIFVYQQVFVEGAIGPAALVGIFVLSLAVVVLGTLTYLIGTRHRELAGNLLLSSIVVVVAYFLLDLAAGWFLIVPLSPPLVPDAHRHHALVPDSYAELRQRDFAYIQRVNRFGLRGPETTIAKPDGTRRVVMLGDSFTMGKGVEDDETFSVLVEKLLKPQLAACNGETVEVLNGGVDSYAPILSYIQLKEDLGRFSPDLVVLNLDNSDLIQEVAYRQQAVRDDNGEIIAVPQIWQDSLYERFLSWAQRRLYLTRVALVYVNRAMNHAEITVRSVTNEFGREHFAHTLKGDKDRTAQWDLIFDSIGKIKTYADSIGSRFLLSTYPWAHQVNETDWVPGRYAFMNHGEETSNVTQQTVRKRARELRIDLFEALPAFKAYTGSDHLYFDFDPHWTPKGHRIMADALSDYIKDHYFGDWCGRVTKLH